MKKLLLVLCTGMIFSSCTKEMPYLNVIKSPSIKNSTKNLTPATIKIKQYWEEYLFDYQLIEGEDIEEGVCTTQGGDLKDLVYTIRMIKVEEEQTGDGFEKIVKGNIVLQISKEKPVQQKDGDALISESGVGTWYISSSDGVYKDIRGGAGTLSYKTAYYIDGQRLDTYPYYTLTLNGFIKR